MQLNNKELLKARSLFGGKPGGSGGGADWNASEGEDGYVKNRTHYGDYVFHSIKPTTFTPSTEKQYLRMENVDFSAKGYLAFYHKYDEQLTFTMIGKSPAGMQAMADGEVTFMASCNTYIMGKRYKYSIDVFLEDSEETGLKNIVFEITNELTENNLICYAEYTYDTLKQLDEKYIPDTVKGADWNAQEGETGYVKNRTHYEAEELVNEPLNITWDGNTEGLVSVAPFYKVSDALLTDEQIKSATVVFNGETITVGDVFDTIEVSEELVLSDFIAFCRKAGAMFYDFTFPEIGVYFVSMDEMYVSSLTTTEPVEQTQTVVHKLDLKYLPIEELKEALGI